VDIAVTETKHFPEGNKTPGETCWCLEQSWFWNKRFRPKKARDIVRQIEIANSRNANFLLNVAPDRQGNLGKASVKVLKEIGRIWDPNATPEPPRMKKSGKKKEKARKAVGGD
jgi:alpha-L-fucosidase